MYISGLYARYHARESADNDYSQLIPVKWFVTFLLKQGHTGLACKGFVRVLTLVLAS